MINNNTIQIYEAINAGNDLLKGIEAIERNLNSASTWGFIDLFSKRGGLLSMLFKHNNLHEAQDKLFDLSSLINKFNKELKDVKVISNLKDVQMDSAIEFCDFVFDGLIVDAYTLSKISQSKDELKKLKFEVQDIMNNLYKLKDCVKE